MSCFDWVVFEMNCPLCAERVTGFQTKSLGCDLQAVMPHLTPNFYAKCDKCGAWIEFQEGRMISPMYDTGVEMLPFAIDGKRKA